jgi:hypothetical protein
LRGRTIQSPWPCLVDPANAVVWVPLQNKKKIIHRFLFTSGYNRFSLYPKLSPSTTIAAPLLLGAVWFSELKFSPCHIGF